MSSLAKLPDLVGFFSYSREDDEGSRGALSALRDAIQAELSAQLGRNQADFRVWQDKSAIPLGTLWENQITQGINQSVFFVPIVTPRALRSQHCAFEFKSFLAREAELGRDDLVFPILYIPVPELEDEGLWRADPVLKVVGTRQYLNWERFRHRDLGEPEVRAKVIQFCRNISNALRKPWVAPEERQQREEAETRQKAEEGQRRKTAEIEAERLAQEERRRRDADAARRTEEEERRKKAEAEARERLAAERRRQEAAGKQRAEEERAFTAARRANSVAAIEAFLAANPESAFAGEAQELKAAMRSREEAYGRAISSDDPVVLRAFREAYKRGADVDQVRARLRLLEPQQKWQLPKPAILVPAAIAVVLVGAVGVWFAMRPNSNSEQVSVAANTPPVPAASPAAPAIQPPPEAKAKVADVAPTAAPPAAAPAAPPAPAPDEVAWTLLQDTSDAAALKRFVAQFPDSPRRRDAETRIAALAASQTAWNLVKDSKDPEQLRRFVEKFPNSVERTDAEQRIASLSAPPTAPAPIPAIATAPDPHELTRLLQFELMRVGCFKGTVNGQFDDDTKTAWHRFIRMTSISMSDDASSDAINAVRGINKRVCPLVCPRGQHAEGEACVANERPPPKRAAAKPARAVSGPAAPAPAGQAQRLPPAMIGITHGGVGIGIGISDIRLKRDVILLALRDNGIALYSFRYFWSDQVYVGVMAQQVAAIVPEAVVMEPNGFLAVNYDRLGLKMQTLEEWLARHRVASPSDTAAP